MDLLRITGGGRLTGEVAISGSKNAALPVMAAALLTDEPLELTNVPDIEDIGTMAAMLAHLGVAVEKVGDGRWRLDAGRVEAASVGADLTRRLRGSFLLLGALVGRTGQAEIAKPGGDDIGMRRVEQHLEGLRLMGAEVAETATSFVARAKRLRGAHIYLDMPTVTGTENLMMAAVLADGITVISNAAREPHVYDLARCLVGMGARISGAGSELIVVEGQSNLPPRHSPPGDHRLHRGRHLHDGRGRDRWRCRGPRDASRRPPLPEQQAAGCGLRRRRGRRPRAGDRRQAARRRCHHLAPPRIRHRSPAAVRGPMTQAEGISIISEALYENRFRHVAELAKMGAHIAVEGRSASITGPTALHGTAVSIPDIRSGAALVIAALCADGTTELENVFHLDRGYDSLEAKLRSWG